VNHQPEEQEALSHIDSVTMCVRCVAVSVFNSGTNWPLCSTTQSRSFIGNLHRLISAVTVFDSDGVQRRRCLDGLQDFVFEHLQRYFSTDILENS